jgi:deazaflavin-dependent oxidoreductase (nitroreductase family)
MMRTMGIADQLYGGVLRLHATLYERTDGRVGHALLGVPTLLLRTTGRRSGVTRTNALVYARDGERYLVVPSNGGSDRPPGWLHNVRAQPRVEVQIGRDRHSATTTVLERGDPDFTRLWEAVNENNRGRYDAYQARTARAIPVVALTPDD